MTKNYFDVFLLKAKDLKRFFRENSMQNANIRLFLAKLFIFLHDFSHLNELMKVIGP